ncbi:serine/threonine-protein kinase [Cohnella sp. 56]|uniref:serine/threonine-protein kinase n=1 Tax=Cohnella sp. 56 TaxID=3113722 RepID=UPI0030EA9B77
MRGEDVRQPLPTLAAGELAAGRYRVVESLGRGGMAWVYLAEDTKLGGRPVALKLTRTYDRGDGFISEARLLSALRHPGLPQIVDYEPPDGRGIALIVMTYVEGVTLAELMRRHGMKLPPAKSLRYLLQLARTLQYLHAQRPLVVFRDLKPANVMIDGADNAILIDFGIAREFKPGIGRDTLMLGTPAFAAPEQLRGEQSDARTDLYGLGALAYHLLTGGCYAARQAADGRAQWLGGVPPAIRDSVLRLLSERPADRPGSAAEVVRTWSAYAAADDTLERSDPVHVQPSALAGGPLPGRRRDDRLRRRGSATRIVAFVSAYPGAGATFAARILSGRLSRMGAAHALVECPGAEPELYNWLDGIRRMPSKAPFADPAGMGAVSPAWLAGEAACYPLRPDSSPQDVPGPGFAAWLAGLGMPVVLLDVSGAWQTPAVSTWLAEHADAICAVADPSPAKWSERRQRACGALLGSAAGEGARICWIANRDVDFAGRADWLRLFPERPRLMLPQLSPSAVVHWLWQGGEIALPPRAQADADDFCATLLR